MTYSDAAAAAARAYCGWIVSPPDTVTIRVDGSGGRAISLPTMHLTDVLAVVEDGVELSVSDLRWSEKQGCLYKKSRRPWTGEPGAIEVTMTHGHDEAPDFDAAVDMVEGAMNASASDGRGADPAMTTKRVDDVEYQWSVSLIQAGPISLAVRALLNPYRILPEP